MQVSPPVCGRELLYIYSIYQKINIHNIFHLQDLTLSIYIYIDIITIYIYIYVYIYI